MKITGFGSISSTSNVKKRGGVSQVTGFADVLAAAEAESTSATAQASDVAATSALDNLLALQEISEEDIQRRKLAQQGKSMLESLEQLHRQLLIGTLPAHVLLDLRRQVALQKQMVNDPKLTAIIEDIEIRAAVELAKLERAMSQENNS